MPDTPVLSGAVARRYLALHHLLAPPRAVQGGPDGVMAVIGRLGSVQFDPLGVAGRNHDLVLHARVAGYRPAWTDELLYERRVLFEAYNKSLSILPIGELPWYRISWDRALERHEDDAFVAHADLARHILERIRTEGPLSSLDFEREPMVDWYWGPTNRVRAILEALWESGLLGLSRRAGNRRYYDLPERLFPASLLDAARPTVDEQMRHKLNSRYRAHGLLGDGGQAEIWLGIWEHAAGGGRAGAPLRGRLRRDLVDSGELLPVAIEGVRGARYVPAQARGELERARAEIAAGAPPGGADPGVTFLAPLDPLCWDRDLLRQLYGFDYVWEVYVPEARRRWGYYVLPLLFGDRLVGRIEPRIDRQAGTVTILRLWWEAGFEPRGAGGFVPAMRAALADYMAFAEAHTLTWSDQAGRWSRLLSPPHRSLAAARRVRAR
ncbi:MAG: winged helix-turn-helix domain-containing protein [Candidatus Limnocylindrales bacterium]